MPGGEFLYGEDKEPRSVETFWIARYPVTNAQYQAFIDAGGYGENRRWEGLHERIREPEESTWTEPNRPRTNVSWYEAMAFCRWLSSRSGVEIVLPTEFQWEKAARGVDGRKYPWGDAYREGYANTNESFGAGPTFLRSTTAAGVYPQGASPYGVLDAVGNVWEWCLNEYASPEGMASGGDKSRSVRGGSWEGNADNHGCSHHGGLAPLSRYDNQGFRVFCLSPISGH